MKEHVKIGVIGYGQRGSMLVRGIFTTMSKMDISIVAVCDLYEDRALSAKEYVQNTFGNTPFCTTDYHDILALDEVDAVLILSSWESHIEIAVNSMKAGKYVGIEVGGAYSIEDCWKLVHTYESTATECMFLENCCYGRRELMVLRMVEEGVFGQIVHCSGGYMHDLRSEIIEGAEIRHYRLRNYLNRNCENYSSHQLGPISKILRINQGNRFLKLSSIASCSKGLNEYATRYKGEESPLSSAEFAQGDIVTTTISCAKGQTIVMTLDTTLPRAYSRGFTVRGTKGMYTEDTDSVFIDGMHNKYDFTWRDQWGNAKEFEEKYEHPIWQEYKKDVKGGHDGIDWLVYRTFIEYVKSNRKPPIDVYDAAAWMSISILSEESISLGGMPVCVPDFTNGRWMIL